MLKNPIILPNGKRIYHAKGTPQGGILPPTKHPYKVLKSDGIVNGNVKPLTQKNQPK